MVNEKYKIINEANWKYLCEGLTFDDHNIQVLDQVLVALDAKTGIISRIAENNRLHGYSLHLNSPARRS